MARTHVQQSQISGSLSVTDDSFSAGSGLTIAENRTLVDDLNDIRKQVRRIIGSDSWSSALSGSQDLADIEAAMHTAGLNADFQGTLDVTGVATFDAAITGSAGLQLAGDLDVNSSADFQGAVNMQSTLDVVGLSSLDGGIDVNGGKFTVADASGDVATMGTLEVDGAAYFNGNVTLGDFNTDTITFTAKAATDLVMDSHKVSGLGQASSEGDALAWNMAAQVGSLTVTGTMAKVNNGADPVGHLYLVGASNEVSASSKMFFDGSLFTLSGSADISGSLTVGDGLTVLAGGLTVAGDSMEVTGSFGVDGPATVRSLTVTGSAGIKISGDVAQRLYIVGADNSIKDEEKLTFDGSELLVTGSAKLTSNLTVEGGVITLSNGASIDSAAVAGELKLDEDRVVVTGDLKVSGNDISGSSGLNITLESAGDVTIAGGLKLMGNELKSAAGNVVLELSGDDAFFKSDVNIAGDLYVKGAMTYIETTNLKVQDAFIHLATGSTGAESSGIVLHGGAGATDDLLMAQDGGAGEFVFGKLAHSSGDHSDIDGDNSVDINNIALVPAWMSELKVGDKEGSLSGSFAADASGAKLMASGSLLLAANSEAAISFIDVGEQGTFATNFPSLTLVGALNSLASAAASSAAKAVYYSTAFAGDVLDFSALGVVPSGDHKYVDVYLNGVLLSQGLDVVSVATGSVTLEHDIVLGLTGDDVITVTLRNAS